MFPTKKHEETQRKSMEGELIHLATLNVIKALIQVSPLAIIALNNENRVILWSPTAEQLFGWSAEEIIGQLNPIVPEDRQTEYLSMSQKVLNGDHLMGFETVRRRKDGSLVHVSITSAPLHSEDGALIGRMAILSDITDRKRIEKLTQEKAEQYNLITNATLEGFWEVDKNLKILDVNESYCKMSGFSREELLGKSIPDLELQEKPEETARRMQQLLATGSDHFETIHVHKGKGAFNVEVSAICMRESGRLFAFLRDITDRKQAEQGLKQSEFFFRSLFERHNAPMLLIDPDSGQIMDANHASARYYGYSRETLRAMTIDQINCLPKDEIAAARSRACKESLNYFIFPHRLANGEIRDVEVHSSPINIEGKILLFSIIHDITERKKTEDALRDREHWLQESQRVTKIGTYRFYIQRGEWENTPVLNEIFGIESSRRMDVALWADIVHPQQREEMIAYFRDEVLGKKSPFNKEYRIVSKDTGQTKWVHGRGELVLDENGFPIIMVGTIQDITERKLAEQKIVESETRLRAIFENSRDALAVSNASIHIMVNPAYVNMFGYDSTEEVMQTSVLDLVAPESRGFVRENIRKRARGENAPSTYEAVGLRKDGSKFLMDARLSTYQESGETYTLTILRDVTEHKQAMDALHASETRLKKAQEIAHVGDWELDLDTRIIHASEEALTIYGFDPATPNLPLEMVQGCVLTEDRPRLDRAMKRLIDMRDQYDERFGIHRLIDGQIRYIHSRAELVIGDDGAPLRIQGIVQDITEQKKAELALRDSEEKYKLLFNSGNDAIFVYQLQASNPGRSRFIQVNDIACLRLGYTRDELLDRTIEDIYPPDQRLEFEKRLERLRTRQHILFESNHVTHDRRLIPVEVNSHLFQINGQDTVISIARDITERRRAEEEVKIDQRRLNSLIAISQRETSSISELLDFALNEVVALSDSIFGYIYYYDEEKKIFTLHSWSKAVMEACSIPDPCRVYALENTGIWGEAVRQRKAIVVNDFPAPNPLKKGYPEGHAPLLKYMTLPIFSEGCIVAVVGVANKPCNYTELDVRQLSSMMDSIWKIAERKQIEAEIFKLNAELEKRVRDRTAELEEANKELEAFSYSVSHDLRAPLRAVDGYSRIIQADYAHILPEDAQKLLENVRTSTHRMTQLIEDLLRFSRLNRQPLNKQTVDMCALVNRAFLDLDEELKNRKVEVTLNDLPTCEGDVNLLAQVWFNLISNALKYSRPRKSARIEIGSLPSPDGGTTYYIKDNGIGFDMRYADKLFGVFQRMDTAREFEGTGVGLALVQRIITRHGGRIWAEAKPDQGATFYFSME